MSWHGVHLSVGGRVGGSFHLLRSKCSVYKSGMEARCPRVRLKCSLTSLGRGENQELGQSEAVARLCRPSHAGGPEERLAFFIASLFVRENPCRSAPILRVACFFFSRLVSSRLVSLVGRSAASPLDLRVAFLPSFLPFFLAAVAVQIL